MRVDIGRENFFGGIIYVCVMEDHLVVDLRMELAITVHLYSCVERHPRNRPMKIPNSDRATSTAPNGRADIESMPATLACTHPYPSTGFDPTAGAVRRFGFSVREGTLPMRAAGNATLYAPFHRHCMGP